MTKLLAPLKRRIDLMVSRAVVRRVNDALKLQGLQVTGLAGEVLEGVEHFQAYGFTSVPKEGAEAVLVFVGGNRSHGIAIAVDDRRFRLKALQEGEVALYDDLGSKVHLKRGGEIEVKATTVRLTASAKVIIDTPLIEGGSAGADRKLMDERGVPVYNTHTHAGGAVPDQQMSVGGHTTTKMRGE